MAHKMGEAKDDSKILEAFKIFDIDGSGKLELEEFGGLLRRLAQLARGAPPVTDVNSGLLGAARLEYRSARVGVAPTVRRA